ncbi:N-acetylneuraminate synthase family protein [Lysinibacillus sp. FSL M8-0134]|uniref:N-acetylneuraminate synthase family protein n=1 Tax=Lysinibacillus sp. FSL M8-0134 TaxID=2921717 RepID=UPI0031196E76
MKTNEMNIGGRLVGEEHPPLIIPEIGINHNGSIVIAKEMIDAAAAVGAEIVKFQTHIPEYEMSEEAKNIIPANANKSIYKIMEESALTYEEELELKLYTEAKGLIYLSTPFSIKAVDRLEKLNVCAYKIGSGECNNIPLVEYIVSKGKPIILSTGMNTIESIKKTVNIIKKRNVPLAILHCTNLYPTPAHLVRLGGISILKSKFPHEVIGFSDHTVNSNASLAAISLGASIIERHFTDTKERIGPDIICSMDKNDLKSLIITAKEIDLMLGGDIEPAEEEKDTAKFAFATVVAIKNIAKGQEFTPQNIVARRPNVGGIPAESLSSLYNRKALRDINKGEHLEWEVVE